MGRAKEHWMKQMDGGWQSVGEKFVCPRCLPESAIAQFIKKQATSTKCSYCRRRTKKPRAAPMDDVLEFISDGLHREWDDPGNAGVHWESAEGGYTMATTDSDELLADYGLDECHEALWDDLIDAFGMAEWVRRDPYGMPPDEERIFTWNRFSEQLRHRTRFVFFRVETDFSDELGGASDLEPHHVLNRLSESVVSLNLLEVIPKGLEIIRVRQHKPTEQVINAADLGPPPARLAKQQNRFSPAGIPMFYGAVKERTAFAETLAMGDADRTVVTTGVFKSNRKLRVLNLVDLPAYPSVFDPERWMDRASVSFLSHFIREARKPVGDGYEGIDYVPTQVVAEYFRHIFETESGVRLDGIKYRSSKDPRGVCFTLFLTSEDCSDDPAHGTTLYLTSHSCRPVSEIPPLPPSDEQLAQQIAEAIASKQQ